MLRPILSKIQYVSDLHLERGFKRIINPTRPILILCGDIGYPTLLSYRQFMYSISESFDKVYVIPGNHEYDFMNITNTENIIKDICSAKKNLFFIQKETRLLFDDIYLSGCTLWSSKPGHYYFMYKEHRKWLEDELRKGRKTIIATHYYPLLECRPDPWIIVDQKDLFLKNNMLAWIYGHSHYNNEFIYKSKAVLTNQCGSYERPIRGYRTYFSSL